MKGVSTHNRPKIVGFELRRNSYKRKTDIPAHSQIETSSHVLDLSDGIVLDSKIQASEKERIFYASFQCISVSVLHELRCNSMHLQHVRLHGNGLLFLPNVLYNMIGLKELEVSWNRLSSLNALIGNLTSLERLDVSFNALVYIPTELSKCTSLKYLNVSDNKIKRIPASLRLCQSLQELRLEYNMLIDVPKFLVLLSSLRVFTYQGNPCGGDCVRDYIETKHIKAFSNVNLQESDFDCARRLLADFNPGLLELFDLQSEI